MSERRSNEVEERCRVGYSDTKNEGMKKKEERRGYGVDGDIYGEGRLTVLRNGIYPFV